MKIKWTDFAKRRKVKLDNFKHMSYEIYQEWCSVRGVEPAPRDQFPVESVQEKVPVKINDKKADVSEIELEKSPIHEYSPQSLPKMKKSEVQSLCNQLAIEYTPSHTKRQLVHKILSLNN